MKHFGIHLMNEKNNIKEKRLTQLGINGGTPIRSKPMPSRFAFGIKELFSLLNCLYFYRKKGLDPGYQGFFEDKFCNDFSKFMEGGYTDCVSSGCASIYVALKTLNLPEGSVVATSPVTDASVIGCMYEQKLVPYLIDSQKNSYNITVNEIKERYNKNIKAIVITHAGGEACEMEEIMKFCNEKNIVIIEDCSQAVGAKTKSGNLVGTFGLISCFSTMYRKNLSISGSSGLVYTKDYDIYRVARQHADRGKKWWDSEKVDMRDPGYADFPGLNWNSDELRCAIGIANLSKLKNVNRKRREFLKKLIVSINNIDDSVYKPFNFHDGHSPFYFPIMIDKHKITCSIIEFSNAIQAEGIGIGIKYGCLVSTWNWCRDTMYDNFISKNALSARDNCFHLYVNEKYGNKEIKDIIGVLIKVQKFYFKK